MQTAVSELVTTMNEEVGKHSLAKEIEYEWREQEESVQRMYETNGKINDQLALSDIMKCRSAGECPF